MLQLSLTKKEIQKENLYASFLSNFFDSRQLKGAIFYIFVIAIAAAEAAIGLAIVSSIYRNRKSTRCTQCVQACPTDVLEMIPWDGCKAKQIAFAPRTEDCVGCKRCESACPTYFLNVRVYLHETTCSIGLDNPLIQLVENYKWIDFFLFPLEIRNIWTFYKTHFTNGIHHYFSYFSGSAIYSRFSIIPFPNVSNVRRSNRIFSSQDLLLFFIMWELELIH
ncbi:hypothetical protein RJ639_003642, partial [Escallonia herrerae]